MENSWNFCLSGRLAWQSECACDYSSRRIQFVRDLTARRHKRGHYLMWFGSHLTSRHCVYGAAGAIGQPNGLNCEISLHDCRSLNVTVTAPVGRWTANDAAELMAFRNLGLAELVIWACEISGTPSDSVFCESTSEPRQSVITILVSKPPELRWSRPTRPKFNPLTWSTKSATTTSKKFLKRRKYLRLQADQC